MLLVNVRCAICARSEDPGRLTFDREDVRMKDRIPQREFRVRSIIQPSTDAATEIRCIDEYYD